MGPTLPPFHPPSRSSPLFPLSAVLHTKLKYGPPQRRLLFARVWKLLAAAHCSTSLFLPPPLRELFIIIRYRASRASPRSSLVKPNLLLLSARARTYRFGSATHLTIQLLRISQILRAREGGGRGERRLGKRSRRLQRSVSRKRVPEASWSGADRLIRTLSAVNHRKANLDATSRNYFIPPPFFPNSPTGSAF